MASVQFEAGCYRVAEGFARAIASYNLGNNGLRDLRFMLVNLDAVHEIEEEAAVNAAADLKEAHAQIASTGNDRAMAEHLSALGYCRLEEAVEDEI